MSAASEAARRRAEAAMWRDLSSRPGMAGGTVVDRIAAIGAPPAPAPEPAPESPQLPVAAAGDLDASLQQLIALLAGLLEQDDYSGRRRDPGRVTVMARTRRAA